MFPAALAAWRRISALALAGIAATCLAAYPERPVRLVVPGAPGGAVDVMGRIVALRLSELLGQNVIVDNRAGATNIIGTEMVACAPVDGSAARRKSSRSS